MSMADIAHRHRDQMMPLTPQTMRAGYLDVAIMSPKRYSQLLEDSVLQG